MQSRNYNTWSSKKLRTKKSVYEIFQGNVHFLCYKIKTVIILQDKRFEPSI